MRMRLSKNLLRQIIPSVGTVILVALMLVVFRAWAMPAAPNQGPGVISYQGTLTDLSGEPLNDNVEMTFKIFDGSTGGTALWTEDHAGANAVPVSEGLFNVLLGSLTPIPSTVWDNASLFLEVTVDGEVLAPREAVGSVPHALYAVHADLAYNLSAADGDPVHAATVDDDGSVHIEGGGEASLAGGGRLVLGPTNDVNIVMDGDEMMARDNGESATLYVQNEGGDLDVGGRLLGQSRAFHLHLYQPLSQNPGECIWSYDTGYLVDDYSCMLVGFALQDGDIREYPGGFLQAEMVPSSADPGSHWVAKVGLYCDSAFTRVTANYACVPSNLIVRHWH